LSRCSYIHLCVVCANSNTFSHLLWLAEIYLALTKMNKILYLLILILHKLIHQMLHSIPLNSVTLLVVLTAHFALCI
jgi:hypothetical protein